MKRKLALLLAMVMVFVSVPFTGFAEVTSAETVVPGEEGEVLAAEAAAEEVFSDASKEMTEGAEGETSLLNGQGDGWRFRVTKDGNPVSEYTMQPERTEGFSLEKNSDAVQEEAKFYTAEIIEYGDGNSPIVFKEGETEKMSIETGFSNAFKVISKATGDATVKIRIFGDDKEHDIGQANIRIHVKNESGREFFPVLEADEAVAGEKVGFFMESEMITDAERIEWHIGDTGIAVFDSAAATSEGADYVTTRKADAWAGGHSGTLQLRAAGKLDISAKVFLAGEKNPVECRRQFEILSEHSFGELKWAYTNRDIIVTLDGWSDEFKEENGGDPFVIEKKVNGIYDVMLNVKPAVWQKIFDRADVSNGITYHIYLEKPDGTVTNYTYDTYVPEIFDEEHKEELQRLMLNKATHGLYEISQLPYRHYNREAVSITSSGENYILTPVSKYPEMVEFFLWGKEGQDHRKEFYKFADGSQFEVIQVNYSVNPEYNRSVTVTPEKFIDKDWITPFADGKYAEFSVGEPSYELERYTYSLDNAKIREKAASAYKDMPLVTKVTIPEASSVSVEGVPELYSIVGNEITFSEPLVDIDEHTGKFIFRSDPEDYFIISYTVGGVSYRKALSICVRFRHSGMIYEEYGFVPVDPERLVFEKEVSDRNNGFVVEPADQPGEIRTVFTGGPVTFTESGQENFTTVGVTVPEDLKEKEVVGVRVCDRMDWKPGNSDYRMAEIVIRNLTNDTLTPRKECGQEGVAEYTSYSFLPSSFEVDGRKVYRIGTRYEVDLSALCLIDWIYLEDGVEMDYFEYFYATMSTDTSTGRHTDMTMPAAVHEKTGLPEPMLYAIYDKQGNKLEETGYRLMVEFFGKEGAADKEDYDYYRISVADAAGKTADLKEGWVTVKFSYPNGRKETEAKNMNFVLSHYQDEDHKSSAKEKLRFEEDGIYVDLKNCSPFLLTWEEPKEEPQPQPKSYTSAKTVTGVGTYSTFWQQSADGSWTVKDRSGRTVTNAWLCDDAVKANGQNVWYLLGADGKMETAPLVQDATGNYYSLETSHNGFYGSLRYKNGNYDGIYMEFSQKHDGTFGRIINQSAIDALKEKYGVKQYGVDNSSCVATSAF